MSTYKNLIGKDVNFLTTDPDNEQAEGQIWYNSTSNVFKDLIASAAWASTGPLSTARGFVGSTGTQTAALCIGGLTSSPSILSDVEEYNGSGWGAGGSLPTATYGLGAAGTQTAALAFGGSTPSAKVANSYTYNGSSWTATPNSMNTARDQIVGGGTQTSALAVGGRISSAMVTNMEEWNGTSWSNLTAMSQARGYAMANGPETAFFIASGATGNNGGAPMTSLTEEYDGSSLSSGANVNTARSAGGAAGDSANALIFGGNHPGSPTLQTEKYDGTSWSEIADLATIKQGAGSGSGTSNTGAIAAGNYGPPPTTTSEEFNQSANVITPAAFSSGGNMPEATSNVADGGTQTAAVKGGGQKNNPDSLPTASAEYNGTAWTAGNTLPSSYSAVTSATGTQTALITGGANNPTPGGTFEYDGTNWTAGGTLGTARYGGKTLGTQTAAAHCGGRVSPPTLNNVEEYDGSSWTAVTAMPIATRAQGGFGTQTAGVVVSGFQGPSSPPVSPTSSVSRGALGFNYDGTNWTTGTSSLIAGANGGAAGIQTVAIYLAGENPALSPSSILTSQTYDGTSYTTNASVARSRATAFGITSARTAAVGTAAMIFGGADPAATPNDTAATEEYNVATSALNIKTITTS